MIDYDVINDCALILVMDYIPRGELFGVWKRLDFFCEDLVRVYVAELAMVLGENHIAFTCMLTSNSYTLPLY